MHQLFHGTDRPSIDSILRYRLPQSCEEIPSARQDHSLSAPSMYCECSGCLNWQPDQAFLSVKVQGCGWCPVPAAATLVSHLLDWERLMPMPCALAVDGPEGQEGQEDPCRGWQVHMGCYGHAV